MLDIKFVRENPEAVKENIRKKFQNAKLPLVDEAIALDAERRQAIADGEALKAERNKLSKANGPLFGRLKSVPMRRKRPPSKRRSMPTTPPSRRTRSVWPSWRPRRSTLSPR